MSRFAPKSPSGVTRPKPFAWSYSKLKNYETCPKRHLEIDILKSVKEEEGDGLAEGNRVHDVLAKAVMGAPLPEDDACYQKWVDKARAGIGNPNVEVRVEQELAFSEYFLAAPWFKKRPTDLEPWFRGKIDVLKIVKTPEGWAALVLDWKTGKIVEDSVQLALFAQCVFIHYPMVEKIRTEFVWLKDDCTTREDFNRQEMPELWAELNPRLKHLIHASQTGEYPPKPGGLCKRYCPVATCAHNGANQ
jgi:hypothetical protein